MIYVHLMEAFGTLCGAQVRYLKTTNPLEPPYWQAWVQCRSSHRKMWRFKCDRGPKCTGTLPSKCTAQCDTKMIKN